MGIFAVLILLLQPFRLSVVCAATPSTHAGSRAPAAVRRLLEREGHLQWSGSISTVRVVTSARPDLRT
jgi:hypothetical protein